MTLHMRLPVLAVVTALCIGVTVADAQEAGQNAADGPRAERDSGTLAARW